ncbi:MAG: LysM peptidoglycan-binding domain-containing protein [Nocardioidaceae bacterium]
MSPAPDRPAAAATSRTTGGTAEGTGATAATAAEPKAKATFAKASTALRGAVVLCVGVAIESPLLSAAAESALRLRHLGTDQPTAGPAFAGAIADLATVAATLAWTWLLLGVVLTWLSAGPGQWCTRLRPYVRAITPRAWQALALATVGVAVSAAPSVLATTSIPSHGPDTVHAHDGPSVHAAPAGSRALSGLPYPDRPEGPVPPPAAAITKPPPEVVVVRAGDSLWSLAERRLPPGTDDSRVVHAWRAWYRLNARVIGPDPDLILPGTLLRTPAREGLR